MKNEPLPSPTFLRLLPLSPHPFPSPPSTVGSAPGPKFSRSPAPLEILGDYGADHGDYGADHGDYGADHGDYGAEALPPDRVSPRQPPFPLSKIDQ